jgi:hypothetical protein
MAGFEILAAQHQSCDVLEPLNFSSVSDGTEYVYTAHRTNMCGLKKDYVKPTYSHAPRDPKFTSIAGGRQIEMVYPHGSNDCSSFVTGALAVAGWRAYANEDIQQTMRREHNSLTTAEMLTWGRDPHQAHNECFEPAPVLDSQGHSVLPGDLLLQRWSTLGEGHVAIFATIANTRDPFGVFDAMAAAKVFQPSDCDRLTSKALNLQRVFSGITMLDSAAPPLPNDGRKHLQNGTLHFYFDRWNIGSVDILPYMKLLCRARLGDNRDAQARTLSKGPNGAEVFEILRHKNTPECQSPIRPVPHNFDCVASCPQWSRIAGPG